MKVRAAAIVAALIVSACSANQYKDAVGPATAKLRLKMEPPIVSDLYLRSVDVESCKEGENFSWVTGGIESLYKKKVGMYDETPPSEGVLEYTVPAGRPIAALTVMHFAKANFLDVLFINNPIQQQDIRAKQPGLCDGPAFLPEAGEQYEIAFRAGPGTCETHIYHLTQSND